MQQQCFKLLPYAGGAVVFFIILFAIYVKSVPPKASRVNIQQSVQDATANAINDILKDIPNAKVSVDGSQIKIEGDPPAQEEETPPAAEESAPEEAVQEEQAAPEEAVQEQAAPEEVVQEEAAPEEQAPPEQVVQEEPVQQGGGETMEL